MALDFSAAPAAESLLASAAPAENPLTSRARQLAGEFEGASAEDIVEAAVNRLFRDDIALVSSFGADSAVLLHMVSRINPRLPVVFVDTGKLFGETLRYRDQLVAHLGLTGLRTAKPAPERLQAVDPEGALWYSSTDACCGVRKVETLNTALLDFGAWITGRKRYQAETRAALPVFERDADRIKVNPLAGWTSKDTEGYRQRFDLPAHPLVADGYKSIGCMPCTDRVADGEDERAGRWRGQAKTECGIHLGLVGRENNGSGI